MTDRIPNVVSLECAARRAEVSEDTMRRAVRSGRVKARQLGRRGHWRVFVDDDGFPVVLEQKRARR